VFVALEANPPYSFLFNAHESRDRLSFPILLTRFLILLIAMTSVLAPSESPLHQVLAFPLLVGLICQHLEPRHDLPALLSSRAFHVAFLEHRWTTLTSILPTGPQSNNMVPSELSPKLAAALERYDPWFGQLARNG